MVENYLNIMLNSQIFPSIAPINVRNLRSTKKFGTKTRWQASHNNKSIWENIAVFYPHSYEYFVWKTAIVSFVLSTTVDLMLHLC